MSDRFHDGGQVVELCIRTADQAMPHRVGAVEAVADVGLAGDRHASRASPRQVLIASSRTYERLDLPPMALRQNVLVDCDLGLLSSGTRLRFSSGVEMVVMFACEPCGRLEGQQTGLLARIGTERGALARVTAGGMLRAGDVMRCAGVTGLLWSNDWRERVRQVLRFVPNGHWVTYSRLAELAGVSSGYCRAFPRLISSFGQEAQSLTDAVKAASWRGRPWDGEGLHTAVLALTNNAEREE